MPKGAIHHLHTTASIPVEAYLEMTRDDRVYYNDKQKLFRVFPRQDRWKEEGYIHTGFIQCNHLRKFYGLNHRDGSPCLDSEKCKEEFHTSAKFDEIVRN